MIFGFVSVVVVNLVDFMKKLINFLKMIHFVFIFFQKKNESDLFTSISADKPYVSKIIFVSKLIIREAKKSGSRTESVSF